MIHYAKNPGEKAICGDVPQDATDKVPCVTCPDCLKHFPTVPVELNSNGVGFDFRKVSSISIPDAIRSYKIGDGPEFTIDVYKAWNDWIGFRDTETAKALPMLDRYTFWINKIGGGQQHNGAEAFAFMQTLGAHCDELVERLKKNTSDAPASAGNTASTPGS